jgi:dihydroxyacetone kinase-like protein
MIKAACGAATTYDNLDEVVRVAKKARDNIRTLGVALSAGSIPQTGEPTFLLPGDEIEIGMGVHGEPGVQRQKMTSADALTAQMLDRILADIPFGKGDEVCLLVNSLGATTMMECLIVNRAARKILAERGITVHATDVGAYVTCQEMAGFSITLMRLDDELKRFYDMPADSVGYRKAGA